MRVRATLVAFLCATSLAPAASAADDVAVIVIGKNPEECGKRQAQLEAALTEAGWDVMPPRQVAGYLRGIWKPQINAALAKTIEDNIQEAEQAYFDAELDRVTRFLGLTDDAIENARKEARDNGHTYPAVSGALLADYYTLKLGVALDAGNEAEARQFAEQVLAYHRTLGAKPELYRPEINAFLQDVRKSVGSTLLELEVLPVPGVIRQHGRDVTSPVSVKPGPHRITAMATGYRGVTVDVDARGESQTVTIRLPFYTGKNINDGLRALLDDGTQSADVVRLGIFGNRPPTVVVISDTNPSRNRTAVIRPRDNMTIVSPEQREDEARNAWAVDLVEQAMNRKGQFLGLRVVRPGWQFAAGGSLGFLVRQQSLFPSDDAPSDVEDLLSSGPSFQLVGSARRLVGQRGYFAADAELSHRLATAGGGTVRDPLVPDARISMNGGWSTRLRPAIGYERRLAKGQLGLLGQAVGIFERYENPSDKSRGFFSSHSRVGVGLRIIGSFDLSPGFRIEGGYEVIPFQFIQERTTSLGASVAVTSQDERGWGAMVWGLPRDWDVGVRLTRDEFLLSYRGTGTSIIRPAPADAIREDVDYDLTINLRRRF